MNTKSELDAALKCLRKQFERDGTKTEIKDRAYYQTRGQKRHRLVIRARARNRERIRIARIRGEPA